MALTALRMTWLAQIARVNPASSKTSVGVEKYLVGTMTTGLFSPQCYLNSRTWLALAILLWMRIASAPAA